MNPRLTYRFKPIGLTPTNGTYTVKQLATFDIAVMARDNRPIMNYTYGGVTKQCPRGLFAGFLNVNLFNSFKVLGITFNDRYPNQRTFIQPNNDGFFAGAFSGVAPGAPLDAELFRFRVQAPMLYTEDPYATAIDGNVLVLDHPKHDTLVYSVEINVAKALNLLPQEQSWVMPDEIEVQPCQFTITP